MTIVRRMLAALAVLAWIAVPVVAALVLTARSEESVQSPPVATAWVPVGEEETELRRPVIAVGISGEAPPLLAPTWEGLVEEVVVEPEQALRSGDPVVVIEGVTRLAVHTPRPFRRTLTSTDRGDDVANLNAWLAASGLEATEGDRYGAATQRGVRALRRELGLPMTDASFDPAWFVYLPLPEVSVRTVSLQAGAPAPTAGTTVAEIDAQVTGARLLEANTGGGTTGAQAPAPSGEVPPDAGAPPTTTAPDGARTPSAPGTTPSAGPAAQPTGTPLIAAAEGAVLEQAGQVVGRVGRDGTVPLETLAALVPLLGDQSSVSVQLVEPAPDGARPVPAATIFNGPTGATCAASRPGPGQTVTVTPVTSIATEGDSATVVGLPDGAREVQVNAPPDTRRLCTG